MSTQDTAITRRTDPVTSHEAAATVDLAGSRTWVMFQLIEEGPLAAFQLESKGRGLWSPSRIRTALNELSKNGLVETTGKLCRTPSNSWAQEWRATA